MVRWCSLESTSQIVFRLKGVFPVRVAYVGGGEGGRSPLPDFPCSSNQDELEALIAEETVDSYESQSNHVLQQLRNQQNVFA